MRPEPIYRGMAERLRNFAVGQRGEGRVLLLTAAAALEITADGSWAVFCPHGSWPHSERWFLVYDLRRGIQIAERMGPLWRTDWGEVLKAVSHWRFLPRPPALGEP